MTTDKPLKIFISYSHQDEKYKDELIVHLSSLKRRGVVEEWHDRKLMPGQDWDRTIKQELLDSDIILLLISSDFLSSNYCFDIEITKAMEKHAQGDAIVIPVILRPCDWKELPFSKLQGLPRDAKPLSTWTNIDEGYLNIIEGIKTSVKADPHPLHKDLNHEQKETISFYFDSVISRLPRGYIILKDIEFKEHVSWAITASYFNYDDSWQHSTHYHKSYHSRWETPEGQDTQCAKLRIPRGDWNFANNSLYLIMELRERQKEAKVEDVLKNYYSEYSYFDYYEKGTTIPKLIVPNKFVSLNKTGDIRDIIEELRIDAWKNYDLETLHLDFESNRRKAYLILYEKLNQNHPALIFVKEIIDDYRNGFDLEKLRIWSGKLSDALVDACKYIK